MKRNENLLRTVYCRKHEFTAGEVRAGEESTGCQNSELGLTSRQQSSSKSPPKIYEKPYRSMVSETDRSYTQMLPHEHIKDNEMQKKRIKKEKKKGGTEKQGQ